MSTTEEVDTPGAPRSRLARSQEARRIRVMEAVLALLEERGYDALRMKDVWERTGVGTDTLYRYFHSREGLIAASVRLWLGREFFGPSESWLTGDTAAEQVLSLCRHTWEVWERHPAMLEPFVRAATGGAGDAGDGAGLAVESRSELTPLLDRALADVDPGFRSDLVLAVDSLTHSAMTFVGRGQLSVDEAYPLVERTLRRLFEHPAMEGHRPESFAYVPTPTPTP